MLVVRVELHSAVTGKVSEIARMIIANDGTGNHRLGTYWGRTARGIIADDHMIPEAIMHEKRKMRHAVVTEYPRRKHVWNLVAQMLSTMRYR